jgi:hypothetical protein
MFYLNLYMNFFTFIFHLFSLQFMQTFISWGLQDESMSIPILREIAKGRKGQTYIR